MRSISQLAKSITKAEYGSLVEKNFIPEMRFSSVRVYDNQYKYPKDIMEKKNWMKYGVFVEYMMRRIVMQHCNSKSPCLNYVHQILAHYEEEINAYNHSHHYQNTLQNHNNNSDPDVDTCGFRGNRDRSFDLKLLSKLKQHAERFSDKSIPIHQILNEIWLLCADNDFKRGFFKLKEYEGKEELASMEFINDLTKCICEYFGGKDVYFDETFVFMHQFMGCIDFIFGDELMDVKVSEKSNICTFTNYIQLLSYYELSMRHGIHVNKISLFNPLQGILHTMDLSNVEPPSLLRYLSLKHSPKREKLSKMTTRQHSMNKV